MPGRSVNINIETEKIVSLDKYVKTLNKLKLFIGSQLFSQGHFHSLELLNIPQFLFCWVVNQNCSQR